MKLKDIFFNNWGLRIGWLIGCVLFIASVLIYGLVGVVFHMEFPALRAGIEQARTDVAVTGCSAGEGAIAIAIRTNINIKKQRYWAHHWLTGLAAPNGWDDIATIEIPECQ